MGIQAHNSYQDLAQFLSFIVVGEQDKAEEMIKKDKNLLLAKGEVTDLSGREFKRITAFQYALWALDWHMWKMLQKYLPPEVQAEQWSIWNSKADKNLPHGKYFSLQPLIDALQAYGKINRTDYDLRFKHWKTVVGMAQYQLPAHVVNEYCHPQRCFYPCPDFKAEVLLRSRICERESSSFNKSQGKEEMDWFAALHIDSYKTQTFLAVERGSQNSASAMMNEMYGNNSQYDLIALQSLSKIRNLQQESLIVHLKKLLLLSPLEQFLRYVAEGEQDKVEEMINQDKTYY